MQNACQTSPPGLVCPSEKPNRFPNPILTMNKTIAALSFLLMLGFMTTAQAADKPGSGPGNVRHIVAFKFKEGTTGQQIAAMEKDFRALQTKIPGIVSFEHGENNSPEGLDQGFTHVYVVTFKNEKARDAYLPHPKHKEFVGILKPILEDVFVVDFTVR